MPSGTTIGSAYVQILPSADGIKGNLQKIFDQEGSSSGESFAKKFGSKLGSGLSSAGALAAKGIGAAVGAAAAGVTALTKSAVDSFGEFEQLTGGAQLMFGDAYDTVAKNAANAFSTVQMSQNEYLTQVNGFATGLKTALGGNEQAAADLAHRIITAEADVVAATGNSQEAVQNAFNGIMKSNFTMLDNLQLGINPTKEGFQEVIDKVNAWNVANGRATNYQMGNLADMQSALVDYIEMVGVAGYAQNEAADTIQGSLASTKAAWSNLMIAFGSGEDVKTAVNNLVSTASVAVKNIIPVVKQALTGIADFVKEIGPIIVKELPGLIEELLPGLLDAAISLVGALIQALPGILSAIWSTIKQLFGTFMEWLRGQNPALAGIIEGAVSAVGNAVTAIAQHWETIKQKASELGAAMQERWESIKTTVTEKVNSLKENVSTAWDNIKATYDAHGGGLTGAAAVYWESLKNIYRAGYDGINSLTGGKLDEIREKFTSIFERVKEIVGNAIDRIKSIMDFDWHLPNLRLPHISIVGSFSLSPPSVPHFEIEWFKKAYDNPYLFTEPSVVGALGFGDGTGGEMVYGHENLMRDIESATGGEVWEEVSSTLDQIADLLQDLRDNGVMAKSYLNNRDVTDYVAMQMRRSRRAGGMA